MNGRRIVWPEKGRTEIEQFTVPAPRGNEVLVETDYSVVSAGTEKSWYLAMPNAVGAFPQHPGYSGCGRIVAVGDAVRTLRCGDRVLLDHKGHCSHALAREGEEGLVKVEDSVRSLDAAFVVIGSMGLQGVRKARPELGESAMVMGLGILGMFAVQAAHLSGGLPVIAVDPNAIRTRIAAELGADHALSPMDPEFVAKIRDCTSGRMVQVTVEVSGSSKALTQALAVAAHQGRIVLAGCTRVSEEPIDFYTLVHRPGVSIIGAHNHVRPAHDSYPGYWTRRDDFVTLLGLLGCGRLKVAPLIAEVVSPRTAPQVYARLVAEKEPPLGIVYDWHA
jgi:2-desacetyl-2-hydroxyethyl bacteriochlorophyllide A dehydrogenase